MDLMTLGRRPSDAVITCARWKISQASLLKRTLVARVIDFLDNRDPRSDGVLKELRSADQQLLRHSAAHIGRWSFQKIGEDWGRLLLSVAADPNTHAIASFARARATISFAWATVLIAPGPNALSRWRSHGDPLLRRIQAHFCGTGDGHAHRFRLKGRSDVR